MSVLETDRVDIVATRKGSQVVKLVICDHVPWDDFEAHALALQTKINGYIAFVEGGQMLRSNVAGMPPNPQPVISVRLLYKPTRAAEQFLGEVSDILVRRGIGFEYEADADSTEA